MTTNPKFTERENDIIHLLLEGKSNKEIASILEIKTGTVEYHLTHIYTKLEVSSRAEAILALQRLLKKPPQVNFLRKYKRVAIFGVLFAIVLAITIVYIIRPKTWDFERECEYPNEATVGQTIPRSQASGQQVHGQFGTIDTKPWTAKSGYVSYTNIQIPPLEHLFLELRYSKHSPSSAQILIFLDGEQNPRAAIHPVDQRDWDRFVWTEPIDLGPVEGGLHSVKFVTEGQEFGVVELDILKLNE